MSTESYDFAIAGAGPAGCAAALRAARLGKCVLLLERGRYPRQKVCGEFISAQGVALLQDLHPELTGRLLQAAPRIAKGRLFLDGRTIEIPIEPAAASVTRFALDAAMWQACVEAGVDCRQQAAAEQVDGNGPFEIRASGGTFTARSVLNAAGRWSNLQGIAPNPVDRWIGLKQHFREAAPVTSVDLYFFPGGYCGVQPVGVATVNACAMVRADVAHTLQDVFRLHPELGRRSRSWQPASELVSTSPLIFSTPRPVRDHTLYAGDAAGFIDPFLGDGMSLAFSSGVLAADCLADFWHGGTTLAKAARNYEDGYRRELLPLFRNAALLRRSLALPSVLRKPLVALLNAGPIGRWVVERTRPAIGSHRHR